MTSAQILQIFGIAYLAIGIGIIINPNFYKQLMGDFASNRPAMYIGGFAALAIGFLLITFHNVWVKDWPVIITVFGWLAFIKGLVILVLPKAMMKICNFFKDRKGLLIGEAVFVTIFGALFTYLGFFVV